jgi:hypothetical protein
MRRILFNPELGLLQAVIDGKKTQTCRNQTTRPFKVGEVLAVAEPFVCDGEGTYWLKSDVKTDEDGLTYLTIGDLKCYGDFKPQNRQGFPAALARHFIKIQSVSVQKPCDFTEAQFITEGIDVLKLPQSPNILSNAIKIATIRYKNYVYYKDWCDDPSTYENPADSFKSLLQALNGKKKGAELFESELTVYTFTLCDRDGKEVVK